MTLKAFGCSYTFGDGLPDIYPRREQPSEFAWPAVLAQKLRTSVLNMSRCGNSNMQIAWEVALHAKKPDTSRVVVMWTFPNRVSYIPPHFFKKNHADYLNCAVRIAPVPVLAPGVQTNFEQVGRVYIPRVHAPLMEMMTAYFRDLQNDEADYFHCLLNIHHTRLLLDSLSIPYAFSIADQQTLRELKKFDDYHGFEFLDGIDFVLFPNGKGLFDTVRDGTHPLALDRCHPGVEAHWLFAEQMFERFNRTS